MEPLSSVLETVTRIESALTFTIVRFVYKTVGEHLDAVTIAFLSILVAALSYNTLAILEDKPTTVSMLRTLAYIAELVRKFAALVGIQAIIRSVQPMDPEAASLFQQIECFTVSLCIIILVCVLPRSFRESADGQQFLRLVLFMFASNTEFVVQRVSFGWTLPYLSMAAFFALSRLQHLPGHSAITATVLNAIILSLTNMMVLASWTISVTSTDKFPQITQLVSLLVIFDALSLRYPDFHTMRDYAIWQGAAQIFELIVAREVNRGSVVTVAVFVVLALQAFRTFLPRTSALSELTVLILINTILGMVQQAVTALHMADTVVVIVLWIAVIHILITAVNQWREREAKGKK
jgi:hypothetical protein